MKRKGSIFALSTVFLSLLAGNVFADDAHNSENRQNEQLNSPIAEQTVALRNDFGKLPLYFIKNTGQLEKDVRYFEKGNGHATYFTKEGVYLNLTRRVAEVRSKLSSGDPFEVEKFDAKSELVKLSLSGSNRSPVITATDELEGKINYFVGGDRSKWKTNIPTYGGILYEEVYKGIDIKYYGNNTQLEYDVIVKPGADYRKVKFAYEGIKGLSVLENGDLEISLKEGVIHQKKPYIYQEIDGQKKEVEGRFKVLSNKGKFAYGFEVASYDRKRDLVIDPNIVYSTYLGGSGADYGFGIAVDPSGGVYVTGYTYSTDFPTLSAAFASKDGTGYSDAFVTKLGPDGALVYSTYLGGSNGDFCQGIAVDTSGNAYVTGTTVSTDFPTLSAAYASKAGYYDAFVAKLGPAGGLVYSTYLGGSSGTDAGYGIAVDLSGSAYVTGYTYSTNFPTLSAAYASKAGDYDAFVTKLGPAGGLVYSTYLGGSNGDDGRGIAVDLSGSAYVTGYTFSSNFPTQSAAYASFGGGVYGDAFVTKLGPAGGLVYSTYLGGSSSDNGYGIAVDPSGSVYVTGYTSSLNFPILSAAYASIAGGEDAFVTKLGPAGGLVYSTYLGGSLGDNGRGIAVDPSGSAYVTGYTYSTNLPTLSAVYASNAGSPDAFVTKLGPAGVLAFSTYLGGSNGNDYGNGIAVDPSGSAYVTGYTSSLNFPTLSAAYASNAGGMDAFITKISFNAVPVLSYPAEAGYGDGLEPDIGTASTTFTYKAVYTDPDNNAPSYMRVCVYGACNAMSVDNGAEAVLNDGDYINGEQYAYSAALAIGSHDYYFEASDGTGLARLPSSAALSGPTVSDLAISTSVLPEGIVGYAYSQTISATGGVAPYTWSQPSGGLPPGLVLNPLTGDISGTPEAAGIYGFSVRATDSTGVYETVSLTAVITADTIAPSLTVPQNITADATSPAGAAVAFAASAADAVDPSPAVNCAPASGSTFPIGANTVACTATDWAGNSSAGEFMVTVLGPGEIISNLIGIIENYSLTQGIMNSLSSKLQNALAAAGGTYSSATCNKIDAFINEVEAQSGKSLTAEQAAQLTGMANNIKNAQACQ